MGKATQRKMTLLHNINISLKQTIQQQMQQIMMLKKENNEMSTELEQYKSMIMAIKTIMSRT